MPRDHRLYLDDILEAIAKVREYTAGLDYGVSLPMVRDVVRNKLDSFGVACVKLLADRAFE